MAERKPTPRDFPVMRPVALARRVLPRRQWQQCACCGLAVDPRNRARHVKACIRRKRLAPELWAQWREGMRTGW